jgi:hypothetical protein
MTSPFHFFVPPELRFQLSTCHGAPDFVQLHPAFVHQLHHYLVPGCLEGVS